MIWCSCKPNREFVQYQFNDYQRLIFLQTCPICSYLNDLVFWRYACTRNPLMEMAQPLQHSVTSQRAKLRIKDFNNSEWMQQPKVIVNMIPKHEKLIYKAMKLRVPKKTITLCFFYPVSEFNKFSTSRYRASLQRSDTPAQFLRCGNNAASSAVISNTKYLRPVRQAINVGACFVFLFFCLF